MSGAGKQAAQQAAKLGGKDKPSVWGIVALTAGTVRGRRRARGGAAALDAGCRSALPLPRHALVHPASAAACRQWPWRCGGRRRPRRLEAGALQPPNQHVACAGGGARAQLRPDGVARPATQCTQAAPPSRSPCQSINQTKRQDVELRSPDTREAGMPQHAPGPTTAPFHQSHGHAWTYQEAAAPAVALPLEPSPPMARSVT